MKKLIILCLLAMPAVASSATFSLITDGGTVNMSGWYAPNRNPIGNDITIDSSLPASPHAYHIVAGLGQDTSVVNNRLTVNHALGYNTEVLAGAYSWGLRRFFEVRDNFLEINANIDGIYLVGAFSSSCYSIVGYNHISILSGYINYYLIAGTYSNNISNPNSSNGNSVFIGENAIIHNFYGGSGLADACDQGWDQFCNGWIIGSRQQRGGANNNTITLYKPTFDNVNFVTIMGGRSMAGGDDWKGNVLNLYGRDDGSYGRFHKISNFETWRFIIPSTATAGYEFAGANKVDFGWNPIFEIYFEHATTLLTVGDNITLIAVAPSGITGGHVVDETFRGNDYIFWLHTTNDGLIAELMHLGAIDNTTWLGNRGGGDAFANARKITSPAYKSLSEAQIASVIALNSAIDQIGTECSKIKEYAASSAYFTAINGGNSTYNTGSSVDVMSFSLMTGAAWDMGTYTLSFQSEEDAKPKTIYSDINVDGYHLKARKTVRKKPTLRKLGLSMGLFMMAGGGSYTAHNENIEGNGEIQYVGIGNMGRISLDDHYLDISVNIGKSKTSYVSDDTGAEYDTKSLFYGLNLGIGHYFNINKTNKIDLYLMGLYLHQNGDTAHVGTQKITFDDIDSTKLKLGTKYTHKGKSLTPFVGVSIEQELSANASAGDRYGNPIEAPTSKGHTIAGELGLKFWEDVKDHIKLNTSALYYDGMRNGFAGSVQALYKF
ncbi:autotransporter outer membrane beta-barrel domain-containing protein [Deferribacterales bacterium RsTz2092]|nr:hypothetical protein AGMMS49941_00430 [Deferribacterales bacterium]